MSSRRNQLTSLERQLRHLQRAHEQQQQLQQQLLIQEQYLAAACDVLLALQRRVACDAAGYLRHDSASAVRLRQLQTQEQALLREQQRHQMLSLPPLALNDGNASARAQLVDRFRQLLVPDSAALAPGLLPSEPRAAADLVRASREALMQLSLQMNGVHSNIPRELKAGMTQGIQAAWSRHLQTAVSLVVSGRYDLVGALTATNYDTQAPLDEPPPQAAAAPEPAAALSGERHATAEARARPLLITALGLSDQQLALIFTGMCMLQQQLQGALQQRQQVLAQLSAPCSEDDCSSSSCGSAASDADVMHGDGTRAARRAVAVGLSSSSSSENGGTATCSPPGCAVTLAPGRHSATGSAGHSGRTDPFWSALQAMHVRQQQLTQLMVVLRKESMLHVLGMGLLVSSLSTLQLSKAALLSWPHPFALDELLPHATAAAHEPDVQRASQRGTKRHRQCGPSAGTAVKGGRPADGLVARA